MDSKQTGHLTIENLDALKAWFIRFVRSFYSAESIVQQAIVLKEDHSHRVREEILHIGGKLGLDDNELRIAEAMGLLHDIGRFEQYARYRTFVDAKSEDHGKLGVKVLHRDNTLADLDKTARDLILRAISYQQPAEHPGRGKPRLPLFQQTAPGRGQSGHLQCCLDLLLCGKMRKGVLPSSSTCPTRPTSPKTSWTAYGKVR